MSRLLLLLALATSIHAAGPVRFGLDPAVVNWNLRCQQYNVAPAFPSTFTLLASSQWMGAVRAAGLYPGTIIRANLMCGPSYGGTNGAGDSIVSGNIGSPQVPLINDVGDALDTAVNISPVTPLQFRWKYAETGQSGGLGCVSTNNPTALDTGIIPRDVNNWTNDIHVCAYMMGGPVEPGVTISAVNASTLDIIELTTVYTGFGQITAAWSTLGFPSNTDTNGTGFYVGTRTSSATNGIQQYRNRTATGSSTTVGGNPTNVTVSITIFGQHTTTPAMLAPISHMCAGYAIGRGVTASQVTNGYYNAWQQFETLMGRQK